MVLCLARRRAASEARHEAPSVGTVFRDLGGDEPFGALDAITRTRIRHDIDMLWMKTRKTGLFMTPSIEETIGLSDRVLVMLGGPGRIIEEIRVDIPDRDNPMKRRQTTVIGAYVVKLMNLLQIDQAAA